MSAIQGFSREQPEPYQALLNTWFQATQFNNREAMVQVLHQWAELGDPRPLGAMWHVEAYPLLAEALAHWSYLGYTLLMQDFEQRGMSIVEMPEILGDDLLLWLASRSGKTAYPENSWPEAWIDHEVTRLLEQGHPLRRYGRVGPKTAAEAAIGCGSYPTFELIVAHYPWEAIPEEIPHWRRLLESCRHYMLPETAQQFQTLIDETGVRYETHVLESALEPIAPSLLLGRSRL